MIHLHACINNPFVRDYNNRVLLSKYWSVTRNKTLEIQLNGFDPKYIIELGFWFRDPSMDHWGVSFEIGLLGFWFQFDFRDNRHRDYEHESD